MYTVHAQIIVLCVTLDLCCSPCSSGPCTQPPKHMQPCCVLCAATAGWPLPRVVAAAAGAGRCLRLLHASVLCSRGTYPSVLTSAAWTHGWR